MPLAGRGIRDVRGGTDDGHIHTYMSSMMNGECMSRNSRQEVGWLVCLYVVLLCTPATTPKCFDDVDDGDGDAKTRGAKAHNILLRLILLTGLKFTPRFLKQ